MSNFKAYNTGGQLGTAIGTVAAPFLGPAGPLAITAGGLIGGLFDKEEKPKPVRTRGYASQGYKYGGKMNKKRKYNLGGAMPTASIPIGQDAQKYVGPKHESGGIPVNQNGDPDTTNPIAEVEGGETEQGGYIFSDELKIPGEDMTFAQMHELLLQQNAPKEQIEELAQMQEQFKQEQGITDTPNTNTRVPATQDWEQKGAVAPMYLGGGKLRKMVNGGDPEELIVTAPSLFQKRTIPEQTLTSGIPRRTPQNVDVSNNIQNTSNINPLNAAQYILPSATRLASAAFTPKPKRTPKVGTERLQPETAVYRDTRKRIGSGFRATPDQAGYARYIQGINQANAQEAQHRFQVEDRNQQNQTRADMFNAQNTARDNDMEARDTAARIGLVDQAINAPVTAALADRRGKQQQIANVMSSLDRITEPQDWKNRAMVQLRAIGLDDQEIARIIGNYQKKYGGKLKKVG